MQQQIGLRVGLEVQEAVWNPIACEELAQTTAVRREVRPDQPHTRSQPDQERTPSDERIEDHIAELLIGRHRRLELVAAEHDRLPCLPNYGREVCRLAGHQVQLTDEAQVSVHPNHALRHRSVAVDDRDAPAHHHEELRPALAGAEQDLAVREWAPLAGGVEYREQLVA